MVWEGAPLRSGALLRFCLLFLVKLTPKPERAFRPPPAGSFQRFRKEIFPKEPGTQKWPVSELQPWGTRVKQATLYPH